MTAAIGHNNPPDPLDDAIAPFGDAISEAEGWLDGERVENTGQMQAVDALLKQIKAAKKATTEARESESKPLYAAWQAALARFKPTIDDLDRMAKGLAALTEEYKKKLAAEKAAAERKAWEDANKARREAEAKAAAADAANIEAVREAEAAKLAAMDAEKKAQAARKDTVKGLRKVTRYEITAIRDVVNWIARNDKDAMAAFAEEYVRKNHKVHNIAGVHVWEDKEAF